MSTVITSSSRFVAACMGFSCHEGDFYAGQLVREDDPAVVAHPELFDSASLLPTERRNEFHFVSERLEEGEREKREAAEREFVDEAGRNRIKIAEPDVVTCAKDFTANYLGHPSTILKGSKALADDPVVVGYKEFWR